MSSVSVSRKNWILKRFNEKDVSFFKENFSLDEITSRLLSIRKIKKEDIVTYLNPTIKNVLPNPHILNDMKKASDRTLKTIIKKIIGYWGLE